MVPGTHWVGWLVGSLFNDAFSVTRLYSVDDRTISELLIGKDLVGSGRGLILSYYPGIHLERLKKPMKNFSCNSRSPGLRIEPGTSRIRSRSVHHSTTTFSAHWIGNWVGARAGVDGSFPHSQSLHWLVCRTVFYRIISSLTLGATWV
jgi:hypothetical protein